MKQKIVTPILALTLGLATALPAFARPALQSDARINSELTAAAVAYDIHNKCPSISGRMMTAMSKAMALRSYAMSLGYTKEEVEAFVKNSSEKQRIFGLRNQYLKQNGVVTGDTASYCRLGQAEISKGSLIGSLLKSK